MKATTIFITRHGFSEHNLRDDVFMGRAQESILTDAGREQARSLGARLAREARVERVICSSLPRALETAEIIVGITGVARLHPEDAFWELSKGDWEGKMPKEIPRQVRLEMEAAPFDFRYGGGESYREVVERTSPVFDRWVAAHPGETLLFVLHGDVIRALLYHAIRFPEDKISDFTIDPCSLNELRSEDGRYHVVRLNDSSHLH